MCIYISLVCLQSVGPSKKVLIKVGCCVNSMRNTAQWHVDVTGQTRLSGMWLCRVTRGSVAFGYDRSHAAPWHVDVTGHKRLSDMWMWQVTRGSVTCGCDRSHTAQWYVAVTCHTRLSRMWLRRVTRGSVACGCDGSHAARRPPSTALPPWRLQNCSAVFIYQRAWNVS
jgi:hypothetical protein